MYLILVVFDLCMKKGNKLILFLLLIFKCKDFPGRPYWKVTLPSYIFCIDRVVKCVCLIAAAMTGSQMSELLCTGYQCV